MESLEITNLIRSGQGQQAFESLNKFDNQKLVDIRKSCKNAQKKLQKSSNDFSVLEQKSLLIKFIVNQRYSDKDMLGTRKAEVIENLIIDINKRQQ